MGMPFVDLKTQFARLEPEIRAAMDRVLAHGAYVMGPELGQLEEQLAGYCGAAEAIGCASGTDALLIPLMALGVGPGDAVFTTPFTFIATAEVVALTGATPVFVDIDPASFNMDPALLRKAVLDVLAEGRLKPRGIIPVDLFGLPADYDAINAVAGEFGLFVLEDAAQSFGGEYKGRRCGALARVAATSFFPAKPLGAYGDGGAIFTSDMELAQVMRSIINHGMGEDRYEHVRIGLNGRLDSLQAAILLVKLAAFDGELAARRRVAQRYSEGLSGLVETPPTPQGCQSAWAQYSVLSPQRERVRAALAEAGVPTAIYYPKPLHLQPAFKGLGHGPGDFPASERASAQIFSLPMHPYLEDARVDEICAVIAQAL